MENRSERQLDESVQKALMRHFPQLKETAAQQLEAIKSIIFTEKDTFAVLPPGYGKSFTMFQAGFNGTAS